MKSRGSLDWSTLCAALFEFGTDDEREESLAVNKDDESKSIKEIVKIPRKLIERRRKGEDILDVFHPENAALKTALVSREGQLVRQVFSSHLEEIRSSLTAQEEEIRLLEMELKETRKNELFQQRQLQENRQLTSLVAALSMGGNFGSADTLVTDMQTL